MDYNSDDYFTYKRNKMRHNPPPKQGKPISKFNFLFQLFVATFVVIFILIVLFIMKFSTKVDIEYTRGDLADLDSNGNYSNTYYEEDSKREKIDKRLVLIQQEENAPSEAKIISDNKNNEVIDPQIIEENNKIDKKHSLEFKKKQEQKQQLQKEKIQTEEKTEQTINEEKTSAPVPKILQKQTLKETTKEAQEDLELKPLQSNVTIMSKVLIGRYQTLEEARAMQTTLKGQFAQLSPYVKKVGSIYSVQMGSYQDFSIARKHAQSLQAQGYEVWIYQQ